MSVSEQQALLTEVGRFHLILESHQDAARFCREQLRILRQRLAESEQAALSTQQPS